VAIASSFRRQLRGTKLRVPSGNPDLLIASADVDQVDPRAFIGLLNGARSGSRAATTWVRGGCPQRREHLARFARFSVKTAWVRTHPLDGATIECGRWGPRRHRDDACRLPRLMNLGRWAAIRVRLLTIGSRRPGIMAITASVARLYRQRVLSGSPFSTTL